ncbi:hypothetical protein [Granulosicoccus antarcticus]|uniref:Uncharacterized protein n=1 Tax=Granulosicoccus antarcticus IMCC3135 TaxID=1192854 RepID=A0A2Z2NQD1_9GAMM|nr:hypothetical protein [Granulosicoccus antarcticus]ASJ73696.1 hypothetical protein IMCC3135_18085 [Granulosicoccus antarcticus IMCC3135]
MRVYYIEVVRRRKPCESMGDIKTMAETDIQALLQVEREYPYYKAVKVRRYVECVTVLASDVESGPMTQADRKELEITNSMKIEIGRLDEQLEEQRLQIRRLNEQVRQSRELKEAQKTVQFETQ